MSGRRGDPALGVCVSARTSMILTLAAFERTVAVVAALTGEPVGEIEAEIRARSLLGHDLRALERDVVVGKWPRRS